MKSSSRAVDPASVKQVPIALPLSRQMRALMGSLVSAIDRRFYMLKKDVEDGFEPETCQSCAGVGYILIPGMFDDGFSIDSDDFEEVAPLVAPTRINSPNGEDSDLAAYLGALQVDADDAGDAVSAVPAVSAPAAQTPAVPSASSLAAIPGPSVLPPPAVTSAALAPIISNVPLPSTPIPGFASLGSGTAPPLPVLAVFADDNGGTRYYTVTKGIRVGVFSGWQNTSPYVTGVAGASYCRYPTLQAAFDAYSQAYQAGFVSYV